MRVTAKAQFRPFSAKERSVSFRVLRIVLYYVPIDNIATPEVGVYLRRANRLVS